MRAAKNASSEGLRERYLGAIAPLLDAAADLDALSQEQKRQVRRRIVRTLFRTRSPSLRARLVPVLAALGMLVVGGVAFATAERLGLLPDLGTKAPSARPAEPKQDTHKRRRNGVRPAVREGGLSAPETTAASEGAASPVEPLVVLPEIPDPLLSPPGGAITAGWSVLPETAEPPAPVGLERAAVDAVETPVRSSRRPARLLAYVAPALAAPVPVGTAPVIAAPLSAPRAAPVATQPAAARVQPSPLFPASPSASFVVAAPAVLATPAGLPAPAMPSVAVAKPVVVPVPLPPQSDLALFGRAMRDLRTENHPAAALAALQEHARVYPRSGLAGERNALQVEALLALHRDREALARLDTMPLDELPRSGERFVVRGELRAAVHRWLAASTDFDHALALVSGSPAWHERALWGRGVARLRCGEREAGMADIERYLDSYPHGRFAAEAAKFFPTK